MLNIFKNIMCKFGKHNFLLSQKYNTTVSIFTDHYPGIFGGRSGRENKGKTQGIVKIYQCFHCKEKEAQIVTSNNVYDVNVEIAELNAPKQAMFSE